MNLEKLECGAITLGNVSIGADNLNGTGKHQHFHPYWELKVYEFDGKTRVMIMPPGEVHGETAPELLINGWVLHCREPMLNLRFLNLASNHTNDYFFPWEETNAICPGGLLQLINAIVETKNKNSNVRLLNALLETLWAAVYQVWQNWREHSTRISSLTDMARYYIEHNYYLSTLSVESVATHFRVTAGHLANMFKKDGLTTARQYIVKTRMNHALRLLRSKRYTVKEVAAMTGWNCQFYFSNCFRRHFGVAPSQAADLIKDESYIED